MASREPEADAPEGEAPLSPLGGTRAQALQRLQVGISLLLGIVLIVGLANVIEQRATQSEATAVPRAPDTAAAEGASPANDPLADAGVLPAEATTAAPPDGDGT